MPPQVRHRVGRVVGLDDERGVLLGVPGRQPELGLRGEPVAVAVVIEPQVIAVARPEVDDLGVREQGDVDRVIGWWWLGRRGHCLGRHPERRQRIEDQRPARDHSRDRDDQRVPLEVFDQLRAGVLADRSQFFKDLSAPFYGANRPGARVSQGLRDSFWLQGMLAGHKAVFDCIKAFSETDFTEDLKKFDVPTLILHGDDDQIVPIGAAALLSSKIVKNATLKIYQGAPHGMCSTLKDRVNAELLAFVQQEKKAAA